MWNLSTTYRSIAKKYFPNAILVTDPFHVVRLINHHFLNDWKPHDENGRRNRGLLNQMRRHEWKLSVEQRINLQRHLDYYPRLKAQYRAKQKLTRYVLPKMFTTERPSSIRRGVRHSSIGNRLSSCIGSPS